MIDTSAAKDKAYTPLQVVLDDAYEQAATGKGQDRHVVAGEPFEGQLICSLERRGHTYNTGQAVKKIDESLRLPPGPARAELLGAINYLAARIIVLKEMERTEPFEYDPNAVKRED